LCFKLHAFGIVFHRLSFARGVEIERFAFPSSLVQRQRLSYPTARVDQVPREGRKCQRFGHSSRAGLVGWTTQTRHTKNPDPVHVQVDEESETCTAGVRSRCPEGSLAKRIFACARNPLRSFHSDIVNSSLVQGVNASTQKSKLPSRAMLDARKEARNTLPHLGSHRPRNYQSGAPLCSS